MKHLIYFLCSILCYANIHGQTMQLAAGSHCYNNDTLIKLPVYALDMNQLKGFNAVLKYDASMFIFQGFENKVSFINNMSVVGDAALGKIFIDLKHGQTFSLGNDTILMLFFKLQNVPVNDIPFMWDTAYYLNVGNVFLDLPTQGGYLALSGQITTQAQNIQACVFENISFGIQAQASTYQWQKSTDHGLTWQNINDDYAHQNSTTDTLNIWVRAYMHNYQYRCLVGDISCGLYSDMVSLDVTPIILQHPKDTVIHVGGTATFDTQANGATTTYLWEISTDGGMTWSSNTLFPAVTTPSITLVNPPLAWHGYRFRCIVSGLCSPPADTTETAKLWIGTAGLEIPELQTISIYPNPTQSYFFVELPTNNLYSLYVYDVTGNVIIKKAGINGPSKVSFPENISNGIYFYRILNQKSGLLTHGKIIVCYQ